MSHTPGPWAYGGPGSEEVYVKHSGQLIATINHSSVMYDGEVTANARLIAAAPELVAESQATVDELTGLVEWLDSIDAAPAIARKLLRIVERHRAALAKVKGEGG